MSLKELAENVGISYVNLSKIKTGKVQGVRFSTLEAICETLNCQPGDIMEFVPGDAPAHGHHDEKEERRLRYRIGATESWMNGRDPSRLKLFRKRLEMGIAPLFAH